MERKVLASGVTRNANYTGLNEEDRYTKGYVSEAAFKILLDQNGIEYEYRPRTDGRADAGDFVIWTGEGVRQVVNVKSAGKPYYTDMPVPSCQMEFRHADVYVGVRLGYEQDAWAEVWGFATRDEVLRAPERTYGSHTLLNRFIRLDRLHPIERVIATAKKKEVA
jgi:hypothetical protein